MNNGKYPVLMKAEIFYPQIVTIAAQSPAERRLSLLDLHGEVSTAYLKAVRTLTRQDAARLSSDGRTLGQVVGHIAEWERFTILAAGEIISGVHWPRIMDLCGYVELDGQARDFAGVDAFNEYQAKKQAAWSWEHIQAQAIQMAVTLRALFANPSLLPWEHLEQTGEFAWQLPDQTVLTMPCAWYLWMVSLEHEAVEHAVDLGIPDIN